MKSNPQDDPNHESHSNHPPAQPSAGRDANQGGTGAGAGNEAAIPMPGEQPGANHLQTPQQVPPGCGNSAVDFSDPRVRTADHLLDGALQNYTAQLTSDPRIAKTAAEFGIWAAYRAIDRAIEILGDPDFRGETPEAITDEIIDATIEVLDLGGRPDHAIKEYLAELRRAQQGAETGRSTDATSTAGAAGD